MLLANMSQKLMVMIRKNAEPASQADGDDMKGNAGAIVPVLTDGLIDVKTEHDDEDGKRRSKKGAGMNPLDVSKMLTMLKKRTKPKGSLRLHTRHL